MGLDGFIGAIARYGLSGLVQRWFNSSFLAGTLAVNVIGCLVIGALMSLVESRQFFSPPTRLFLLIGLLGSFTTFSTVGCETFVFLKDSELQLAALNFGANMVVGTAAVALGWISIRALVV